MQDKLRFAGYDSKWVKGEDGRWTVEEPKDEKKKKRISSAPAGGKTKTKSKTRSLSVLAGMLSKGFSSVTAKSQKQNQ